jgi:hypothetical protein
MVPTANGSIRWSGVRMMADDGGGLPGVIYRQEPPPSAATQIWPRRSQQPPPARGPANLGRAAFTAVRRAASPRRRCGPPRSPRNRPRQGLDVEERSVRQLEGVLALHPQAGRAFTRSRPD